MTSKASFRRLTNECSILQILHLGSNTIPTPIPNITFPHLNYGTGNLIGFYLDCRFSEIVPLSAIWISDFQTQFQLDFKLPNPDSKTLYWVLR